MVREIVLDTETTGLSPDEGHRIVEIGCLELENHIPTGRTLHHYINPEREVDQGAFEVHGLSTEFLKDFPTFGQLADEILEFLGDATLVIHNAPFDMRFINAELKWAGRAQIPMEQALDTLKMARQKFPGAQASLDALCRRFEIENSHRTLHGALLDSELLAEVYLELIGGRQPDLVLGGEKKAENGPSDDAPVAPTQSIARAPRHHAPSEEELAAHSEFLKKLKDPIWTRADD